MDFYIEKELVNGKMLCKKGNICLNKKDGRHESFRWITRTGNKGENTRWEQRISIPQELMEEILLLS